MISLETKLVPFIRISVSGLQFELATGSADNLLCFTLHDSDSIQADRISFAAASHVRRNKVSRLPSEGKSLCLSHSNAALHFTTLINVAYKLVQTANVHVNLEQFIIIRDCTCVTQQLNLSIIVVASHER